MANQEIINKNKKSGEIKDNIQKVNTRQIIDTIFGETKADKKQLEQVILDSKLILSTEITQYFLRKTKEISEKTKKNPIDILKSLLEAQKKQLREKNDIKGNIKIQSYTKGTKEVEEQERLLKGKQQKILENKTKNQAEKTQNQAEKTKNQAEKNRSERIKRLESIRRVLIQKTKESYEKLTPNLRQHTPEELQKKIKTIPGNTRERLRNAGISLSEYANFSLARDKIQALDTKSPQNEDYLTTLRKMEKSLGITEKTNGGYPLNNAPREETFRDNPQLLKFVRDDESLKSLEKISLFGDKMSLEKKQKVFQIFGDAKKKHFSETMLPLLKRQEKSELEHTDPGFTPDEVELLKQYQLTFEEIKTTINTKNTNYLKAAAAQAPLIAILRYLDQDFLGRESLADLMQKGDKEYATIETTNNLLTGQTDKIMKIKGTIKEKPITIYYNLTDPNASLECEDHLYTDPMTGQLSLGETGKRKNLNIKMPPTDTISDNLAKECSANTLEDMFFNADSFGEYNEKLSSLVSSSLDNFFISSGEEPRISERLARDTEKNISIQLLTSGLIPSEITAQLKTGELNSNPLLKKLFLCLDKTSESLTTDQLKKFIVNIEKLTKLLNSPDEIKKNLRSNTQRYFHKTLSNNKRKEIGPQRAIFRNAQLF